MSQEELREANKNTDKELWREVKGDYFSPSIHIAWGNGVGMNVGGRVIVMPIRKWHKLAEQVLEAGDELPDKIVDYDHNGVTFVESVGEYERGFNEALDLCLPIVAKLKLRVAELDEENADLTSKLEVAMEEIGVSTSP